MAKNPLYIGTDKIKELQNVEEIKHGATIVKYDTPQKVEMATLKQAKKFISIDIETTPTGEVMLLGYCNEIMGRVTKKGYSYLYRNEHGIEGMVRRLLEILNHCSEKKKDICFWSEFESVAILNLLMEYKGIQGKDKAPYLERFSKGTKGSFNKTSNKWLIEPVIEVEIDGHKLGINQNILGRLNMFFQTSTMASPFTVFGLDASVFYENNLETEAQDNLNWDYQKGNENTHIINWEEFGKQYIKTEEEYPQADKQKGYVLEVLESNKNDCYAAMDLMLFAQQLFIDTFHCNPKIMFSTGGLARTALSKYFEKNHHDLESLNWNFQMEDFLNNGNTKENIKSLFNIAIDSYNAGLQDILHIGFTKKGTQADITSSYPSIMANALLDLRGSKIITGGACKFSDVPKPNGTNYVFVTPIIEGVDEEDLHTITLKTQATKEERNESLIYNTEKFEEANSPLEKNLRPCGDFIASVLYEEVKFLQNQMKKRGVEKDFEVLEWVEIQTKGKPAPIKSFIETYFQLRKELKEKGDKRQFMLKLILNAVYGNFYQCIPNVIETKDGFNFEGWTGGKLFNPIYATVICAYARLRLAEAQSKVQDNGGKPILQAIDALHWEGTKDMLPENFESVLSHYEGLKLNGWRSEKTLCFFEEPKEFTNGLYLKPGIYEYFDEEEGVYKVKAAGHNLVDFTIKNQPYLFTKVKTAMHIKKGTFDPTRKKGMIYPGDYRIMLKQRLLISPGMLLEKDEEGNYVSDFSNLGCIITRDVEIKFNDVVPKRKLYKVVTFEKVTTTLTPTYPIDANRLGGGDYLLKNHDGSINWMSATGAHFDGRLISYREMVKDKNIFITKEEKVEADKVTSRNTSKKHREKCQALRTQILETIDHEIVAKRFGESFLKRVKMAEKAKVEPMKKLLLENGITPRVE